MPHLVIQHTPNIRTDFKRLCRSLLETLLSIRDAEGLQAFPEGGTRVMAFPAADFAVGDGQGDYGFMYLSLRIFEGRGAAVVKRYFKKDADCVDADQWFDTGDVAAIHPDGSIRITDRAKDVIKSGGEWISSIEIENAAVACPGVAEAAAIGIPHPRWDERPLLVIVRDDDSDVSEGDIRSFLTGQMAKWWLPDAIAEGDEPPPMAWLTAAVEDPGLNSEYPQE